MGKQQSKGVSPVITLDRTNAGALYLQIARGLRAAIETGNLPAGSRLAATRTLASDWGVSRNTVVQAFDSLIAEGFLVSRVGDGTYVGRVIAPASPEAGEVHPDPSAGTYPFRGLSRRGRALVTTLAEGIPERPVPFCPDVPDLREFPIRSWLRLMNEVSGGLRADRLGGVSSAGHFPLRKAIAHHVRATRGLFCEPEQVIITTGSQQGVDLISRLLTDRGDPVWMEDPGYIGTRAALLGNGCNVQPVPVDAEGIDVAAGISDHLSPRLICISPARQYPTGAMLTPKRAVELLSFAARSGAWIIEDDYDSEAYYDGPRMPALRATDASAPVVFMGTFSKTLVPSLRLGFVIAPPDLVDAFAAARRVSQGNAPLLDQMVLAEMMNRGIYASHVRRMRVLYRSRQSALVTGLSEFLGYRPRADELRSGMHLILPLRSDVRDLELAQTLAHKGVVARPASMYYAKRRPKPGLLLGFAAFPEEAIMHAARKLAGIRNAVSYD